MSMEFDPTNLRNEYDINKLNPRPNHYAKILKGSDQADCYKENKKDSTPPNKVE